VTKLRDGDIRVLTSCEIISEGFDAPAVGGAIPLRPTQNFALFRQQVGRCLRPKPDGSAAIVVDHVANVQRHGLPDAVHQWSLDSKKRSSATGCADPNEPDDSVVRRELPAERDGELAELVPPRWARGIDLRNARGWQWFQLLQHAAGDPARLREIQVARNYKPAWARYAAQEAAEKRGVGATQK
jgi:DNA repair protein RadD